MTQHNNDDSAARDRRLLTYLHLPFQLSQSLIDGISAIARAIVRQRLVLALLTFLLGFVLGGVVS